jgi:hypothetical protein
MTRPTAGRCTFGRLELLGLIEDYQQGLSTRNRTTLYCNCRSRYAASAKAPPQGAALNRHPVPEWVHQQVYLHPYPKELMLRNHV